MKRLISTLACIALFAISNVTTLAKADKSCATLKVVRQRADPSVTYINYNVDTFDNMMVDPNSPPSLYYIRTFWMSAAIMRVDISAGNETRDRLANKKFTDNRYTTQYADGLTWYFEAPCVGNLIHTWVYITLYDLNGKFVESLKIDITENK